MSAKRPFKSIALLFLAVLVFYAVAYFVIEHRRTRNGPWTIAFFGEAGGQATLRIDQPVLGITNVQIRFRGLLLETNLPETKVAFERPRRVPFALPFGECIFMDTTFQPGTVVIRAGGNEVQVLPRVLTIDNVETPWKPGSRIVLEPGTNAPALQSSTTE
jgi:hypothetical protein